MASKLQRRKYAALGSSAAALLVVLAHAAAHAQGPTAYGDEVIGRRNDRIAGIWRKRHQDYIDRVARESIETTAKNLHVPEDMVSVAKLHGSDFVPQMDFFGCLADRRVARLYQHLLALPSDEARQFCLQLFQSKLEMQKRQAEAALSATSVTERAAHGTIVSAQFYRHAICAAVLLSSGFCSPEDVLQQVDQWNAMVDGLTEGLSAQQREEKQSGVQNYVAPQPLFVFNVYTNMLFDREQIDLQDLQQYYPGQKLELNRSALQDVPLMPWDFNPLGPPAEPIRSYLGFRSWTGATQFDRDAQAAKLAKMRATLEALAKD